MKMYTGLKQLKNEQLKLIETWKLKFFNFSFYFSFTAIATANWGAKREAERRDDEYDYIFL